MEPISCPKFGRPLLMVVITTMVFSFGFDLFRPMRKYIARRRPYFKRFRKMLRENNAERSEAAPLNCPSCRLPFDKGKKRRLIDTCGHERCYTCIFTMDNCPLCNLQGKTKYPAGRSINLSSTEQGQKHQRPVTLIMDNHRDLSELAKLHHSSSHEVRKASSLWAIGGRAQCMMNMEAAEVEHHADMNVDTKVNGHQKCCEQQTVEIVNKPRSLGRKSGLKADQRITTDVSPVSTLSMSSQTDRPMCYNSLRSREQSLTSLMSISSSSSTIPMDLHRQMELKNRADIRHFSLSHCSNFSLELSQESALTTITEKFQKLHPLTMKPLYFEVPQPEAETLLVGRQWVFREIEKMMTDASDNKGMVITGGPGSGKTSIILQLVDYSSFGRKWEETIYQTTQDIYWRIRDLASSRCSEGDRMSTSSGGSAPTEVPASPSIIQNLASKVIGYHFCQSDCRDTCLVPDFVHSLSAQLCQAPQLTEYRDLLMKEPRYQHFLSLESSIANAEQAFVKGILEPLELLTRLGQLSIATSFIVIDSIQEAEYHRFSPQSETIASFLSKCIPKFPQWLKVILTVRTADHGLVSSIPMHRTSLDRYSTDANIQRDILNYARLRISNSNTIQNNITSNKKKEEDCIFSRFADHLAVTSKGCFLYVKLTLDLLQKGHLVIKSNSYSVLPIRLNEIFLLIFNIRFATSSNFTKVNHILNVCLASLYPLTALELFHTVNASHRNQFHSWPEFIQHLEVLTSLQVLVLRQDGSLMIAHPSLREWLQRRDKNEAGRFLCDVRMGHSALALRMTRLESPLNPERSLELAYHIVRANVFNDQKNQSRFSHVPSTNDLQAWWFQLSSSQPSAALSHPRNIYAPSVKVSRLLLEAGSNPNSLASTRDNKPVLSLASQMGYSDIVSLLLEFGAQCDTVAAEDQLSALSLACQEGHANVVRILVSAGAKINVRNSGRPTPVGHAAKAGHLDIVAYLSKCQWPESGMVSRSEAMQEALVAAASSGHLKICEALLNEGNVALNECESVTGHTPLTTACLEGKSEICEFLLKKGASVRISDRSGTPPIIFAVRSGLWEIVEAVIQHEPGTLSQTDKDGKTALMWAAEQEKLGIMELLFEKGVQIGVKDAEGLSALSWACRKNSVRAVRYLLDKGAAIENKDKFGKTPLFYAAEHGDDEIIGLLLKHGAAVEFVDKTGKRPLEYALSANNLVVVSKFLHQGVKLGPRTWSEAEGKPKMILILLHKLLSDGTVLYKKEKLHEASHRFLYALKKIPKQENQAEKRKKFTQLRYYLYLGLSKCKRKMKQYGEALNALDEAMKIRPNSFEVIYFRARINHEAGHYEEALTDINEAIRLSNSDPEVVRTLQKLKEDVLTSSKVVSPLEGAEIENISVNPPSRCKEQPVTIPAASFFHPQLCRTKVDNKTGDSASISIAEGKTTPSPFCMTNGVIPAVH